LHEFGKMPQLRGLFSDQKIPINMKVIAYIKSFGLKSATTLNQRAQS